MLALTAEWLLQCMPLRECSCLGILGVGWGLVGICMLQGGRSMRGGRVAEMEEEHTQYRNLIH